MLVVALIVAGLVFALAPERPPAGETVTLVPIGSTEASGTARLYSDGTGTALQLRVEDLAAGDYVVTVVASPDGDTVPAGGFSSDGGVVELDLHTSATSGDVTVSHVQEPGEDVLSGRFG